MTFDFETLNYLPKEDEKQMSKSTTLNAYIKPFMVSTYVKLPDSNIVRNFCHAHSGKEFIHQWFEFLFEYSEKVCEANKSMYSEVLQKLTDDTRSASSNSVSKCEQFINILE